MSAAVGAVLTTLPACTSRARGFPSTAVTVVGRYSSAPLGPGSSRIVMLTENPLLALPVWHVGSCVGRSITIGAYASTSLRPVDCCGCAGCACTPAAAAASQTAANAHTTSAAADRAHHELTARSLRRAPLRTEPSCALPRAPPPTWLTLVEGIGRYPQSSRHDLARTRRRCLPI